MCTVQDQFKGFLASHQLKIGAEIGVKDMAWDPVEVMKVPDFLLEEMSGSMLVGRKAERFLSVYLGQSKELSVLAENIQIIEEKVTLGELDAIILDNERIFHLELVYKFYLFDPTLEGEEITKWIGPNRKDYLHSKLEKLKTKQFPFLVDPATVKQLNVLGIDAQEIDQEVLFLANCFVPWNFQEPSQFSVDGYWLTREQILGKDFHDRLFFIPSKHEWMIRQCSNVSWQSQAEFERELNKHHSIQRSPLVWIKNGIDSFERAFAVWW